MSIYDQRGAFLKARTALRLRLFELRAYMADRFHSPKPPGRPNVLIFGQGRSGSTLLENLLVSTGHFTGYHEALNTVTREVIAPDRFIRGLGRLPSETGAVVHVKPEHLDWARRKRGAVDARAFVETLVADGWAILHLQRQDLLRQMVSKYVAEARGGFHKTDDRAETIRLEIPVADFIADYERRFGLLDQEHAVLEGIPHRVLFYETHLEDSAVHQQTIDEILDALNLERRPVSTALKKIASASPADHLKNCEALEAAFTSRGWEWTL